jgi:hypothetical protein
LGSDSDCCVRAMVRGCGREPREHTAWQAPTEEGGSRTAMAAAPSTPAPPAAAGASTDAREGMAGRWESRGRAEREGREERGGRRRRLEAADNGAGHGYSTGQRNDGWLGGEKRKKMVGPTFEGGNGGWEGEFEGVSKMGVCLEQLQWGPLYGPLLQNLEVGCKKSTPAGPLNGPPFCMPPPNPSSHPPFLEALQIPLQTVGPTTFLFFPSSPSYPPSSGRPSSQSRRRGGTPPGTASEPAHRRRSPGPWRSCGRAGWLAP